MFVDAEIHNAYRYTVIDTSRWTQHWYIAQYWLAHIIWGCFCVTLLELLQNVAENFPVYLGRKYSLWLISFRSLWYRHSHKTFLTFFFVRIIPIICVSILVMNGIQLSNFQLSLTSIQTWIQCCFWSVVRIQDNKIFCIGELNFKFFDKIH